MGVDPYVIPIHQGGGGVIYSFIPPPPLMNRYQWQIDTHDIMPWNPVIYVLGWKDELMVENVL